METFRPGHYMDFNWQMCYASEFFDLQWFLNSKSAKAVRLLTEEYLRYKNDPMNPCIVGYWERQGIAKDYHPCDIDTAPSRRQSRHYSILRPAEPEDRPYPVVYFCHGGGQDAFEAECYGLAERIPQDKFLYVCPNQYGPEEFRRILGEMKENGYRLDESRIYVMGFSGGSNSAAEIALACPELVAGAALIPGPNAFNQMPLGTVPAAFQENERLRVPVICIGGRCDGGDSWPLVDDTSYQNLNHWMQYVSKAPGFRPTTLAEALARKADSPSSVEKAFGLSFDRAYINEVEDTYCYVGDYLAGDGVAIARFCTAEGLPHGVFPVFLGVAWAFLQKFSRDPKTGALEYKVPDVDFRTWRKKKEGGE